MQQLKEYHSTILHLLRLWIASCRSATEAYKKQNNNFHKSQSPTFNSSVRRKINRSKNRTQAPTTSSNLLILSSFQESRREVNKNSNSIKIQNTYRVAQLNTPFNNLSPTARNYRDLHFCSQIREPVGEKSQKFVPRSWKEQNEKTQNPKNGYMMRSANGCEFKIGKGFWVWSGRLGSRLLNGVQLG